MSAHQDPNLIHEKSSPVLWTVGFVLFVLLVTWWFAEMFRGGRSHAMQHPLDLQAAAPAGPAEPDHADFIKRIQAGDKELLKVGQQVYEANCTACHGQLGGAPVPGTGARDFSREQFKHGGAPYTMYLTLKEGFQQMPAQPQLDPAQKYAVVHYVREVFVKPNNPDAYAEVTEEYLASAPWPAPGATGAGGVALTGAQLAAQPLELPIEGAMALVAKWEEPADVARARAALRQAAMAVDSEPVARTLLRLADDEAAAPFLRSLVAAVAARDAERFARLVVAPGRNEIQPRLALLDERQLNVLYQSLSAGLQAPAGAPGKDR